MNPANGIAFSIILAALVFCSLWGAVDSRKAHRDRRALKPARRKYKLEFIPFRETSLKKLQLQPASGMLEERLKEIPMEHIRPAPGATPDPVPPQAGDRVRMTMIIVGEVAIIHGSSTVGGFLLDHPGHTVDILSRATSPLPNEPGTWWLDYEDDVWRVDEAGKMVYLGIGPPQTPEGYGPFRQLVLKAGS